MRGFVFAAVLGLVCAPAAADFIPLVNGDMETQDSGEFGEILGWGPNGGWGFHSNFSRPGNETLGERFGFYSAGSTEIVGQSVAGYVFEPNSEYVFTSWAYPGGNEVGTIPYQIGYEDDNGRFAALATAAYDITGQGEWLAQPGVTYATGDSGAELGCAIIVRLGDANAGGDSDIWFDSFTLTPEPASLALLALGALALRRR